MATFRDPEFWVAIAFVIAFAFLAWKAGPVITRMLDGRAAKIKTDLEEAAKLRNEARRTLAEFQQRQRDALKEAEAIVAQAKLQAERAAQTAERDLAAALERRQQQAVEKISLAEAKALVEVRHQAVDVAIAAVRRILADDLPAARTSALIDDAIADLSKLLN
jgi:F-type H+-transporting ATPase subunit b